MYQYSDGFSQHNAYPRSTAMDNAPVVLVVDDERPIVDLLEDLLQDQGYVVRRAYDGMTALQQIDREMPDLVVTDVMMPRLDGLTLFNEIRTRAETLPVILMSAAVTPRKIDATFVPKPFDIDMLLDIVDEKLQGR
jgi:two-component system, OmpR family, response regulator MprA